MNRLLPLLLVCAACNSLTTPPPAKPPESGGGLHIQVQQLENAQAKDVVKVLEETMASRSASGGGFRVVVDQDHNALVLSGTIDQIQDALKVVAQLDSRPGR